MVRFSRISGENCLIAPPFRNSRRGGDDCVKQRGGYRIDARWIPGQAEGRRHEPALANLSLGYERGRHMNPTNDDSGMHKAVEFPGTEASHHVMRHDAVE